MFRGAELLWVITERSGDMLSLGAESQARQRRLWRGGVLALGGNNA